FWYAALGLSDRFLRPDLVAWAAARVLLLNALVLGATGLGVLVQVLIERRAGGKGEEDEGKPEKKAKPAADDPNLKWWEWLTPKRPRAA
ncbi:MAG TPA: hypothetical protein VIL46_17965, partial [Gemmataceae bacterium]